MELITAPELALWLTESERDSARPAPFLLDVRELSELQHCLIPQSFHMPMNSVPGRLSELDQQAQIVCICHHGARSMQVARFLEQQGFDHVINLTGGIHAWATQVDSTMGTY